MKLAYSLRGYTEIEWEKNQKPSFAKVYITQPQGVIKNSDLWT